MCHLLYLKNFILNRLNIYFNEYFSDAAVSFVTYHRQKLITIPTSYETKAYTAGFGKYDEWIIQISICMDWRISIRTGSCNMTDTNIGAFCQAFDKSYKPKMNNASVVCLRNAY